MCKLQIKNSTQLNKNECINQDTFLNARQKTFNVDVELEFG